MNFTNQEFDSKAIKISARDNDQEIGRAFLYIIKNNLHEQPYGLLEDVFVQENHRGHGVGEQLVRQAIALAKKSGCYKLVGNSRYERETVHAFYQKLGFADYGKEFRINL